VDRYQMKQDGNWWWNGGLASCCFGYLHMRVSSANWIQELEAQFFNTSLINNIQDRRVIAVLWNCWSLPTIAFNAESISNFLRLFTHFFRDADVLQESQSYGL